MLRSKLLILIILGSYLSGQVCLAAGENAALDNSVREVVRNTRPKLTLIEGGATKTGTQAAVRTWLGAALGAFAALLTIPLFPDEIAPDPDHSSSGPQFGTDGQLGVPVSNGSPLGSPQNRVMKPDPSTFVGLPFAIQNLAEPVTVEESQEIERDFRTGNEKAKSDPDKKRNVLETLDRIQELLRRPLSREERREIQLLVIDVRAVVFWALSTPYFRQAILKLRAMGSGDIEMETNSPRRLRPKVKPEVYPLDQTQLRDFVHNAQVMAEAWQPAQVAVEEVAPEPRRDVELETEPVPLAADLTSAPADAVKQVASPPTPATRYLEFGGRSIPLPRSLYVLSDGVVIPKLGVTAFGVAENGKIFLMLVTNRDDFPTSAHHFIRRHLDAVEKHLGLSFDDRLFEWGVFLYSE